MPSHIPSSARRLAALKYSLRLAFGLLAANTFRWEHHPFQGDQFAALEWLRNTLRPFARRDRFLSSLLRVLDQNHPPRPWSSPRGAKAELFRMAARVQVMAVKKTGKRNRCQGNPSFCQAKASSRLRDKVISQAKTSSRQAKASSLLRDKAMDDLH
jgi:hypothetical protein